MTRVQHCDIYGLRDAWTQARSIALVGNAATILEWDNGALIDSYDVVIRFNRAYVAGIEAKVGSRTDILVANARNSLERGPSPADTLKPRCILCFVNPEPISSHWMETFPTQTRDIEPFREWAGNVPTVITLSPDIPEFATAHRQRGLTMGTYMLYMLPKLFQVERLFVTGFTMYGAVDGRFQKYFGEGFRNVGTYHDLDEEARLFTTILASFQGDLRITSEVDALLRRHGHAKRLSKSAVPEAPRAPSTYYRMVGRLSWQLLRLGFKLRRKFERGTSISFERLQK
jgi:hypothetical protein